MKYWFFLLAALLFFFSCTTKEDKAREFVEQEVVQQAENYLIRQSILKYVAEEAIEVFKERYNYYAQHPDYDFSYIEKEMSRLAMAFASAYGGINKIFDERRIEFSKLYSNLSNHYNIIYGIEEIDSTLTYRDLIKETSYYSIDEIADIYFKPNHLKFTEITPELFDKIYRCMLCLGAKTYKYDVVDDIRIKEKDDNKWAVDLVYHSGFCMSLEISSDKEFGFYVSEAPWLLEVGVTEVDLGIEDEDNTKTMSDEAEELLVIDPNTAFTPEEQEASYGHEVKGQANYDLNGDGENEIIEYIYQPGVNWGDPEVDYKPMLKIYIKWSDGGTTQLDGNEDHWLKFIILSTKTNGVYDLASGIRGVTYRWNGSRYSK